MRNRLLFLLSSLILIPLAGTIRASWVELTDSSEPGLGAAENVVIHPGPVYDGKLLITTEQSVGDAGGWLLYSEDGVSFSTVTQDSFGLGSEGFYNLWPFPVTLSDALYFSATNPPYDVARIFKSTSGPDGPFNEVVSTSLEAASTDFIITSAVLAGERIFVGTANQNIGTGGSVHSFNSEDIWDVVATSAEHFGDDNNIVVHLSGSVGGYIYCGTFNSFGGGLYRYNYSNETWYGPLADAGFGDEHNVRLVPAPGEFNGYTYVAAGNTITGAQVWRSRTGDAGSWEKVLDFSGGSSQPSGLMVAMETARYIDNQYTTCPETISIPGNGYLYISFYNDVSGTQIWRTDGSSWQQINTDGFGRADNRSAFLSPALFNGYLYAGTLNISGTGARLYRILAPPPVQTSVESGEVIIIGSSDQRRRGTINPDMGDKVRVAFKGSSPGSYTLTIYTLLGEEVYRETRNSAAEGEFNWAPGNLASGTYLAHLRGPGVDKQRKIAILR